MSASSVPILGVPPKASGGREYAVALSTVGGVDYLFVIAFTLPVGGNGAVDLQGVKDFNPHDQAMGLIRTTVLFGLGMPINLPTDTAGRKIPPPPILEAEGGHNVVPAHVVSFRWLGEITDRPVPGMVKILADDGTAEHWMYGPDGAYRRYNLDAD